MCPGHSAPHGRQQGGLMLGGNRESGTGGFVRMAAARGSAESLLRLGVVGVGVMGSNHARVIAELPGVEFVGVADPDRPQANFVAETLGCAAVGDLDELIELGIDAATIAAPTHLHHDLALACIRRGIHVMVEKPIASSAEEGRSIIAAARRANVILMVGHVERFNPAVAAIKEAIHGEDILSIAITRVGPFPPRMSNVGVVIDLAVHDIDLIRWLTPFKARNVHVATRKKYVMGDLLTRQVTECFGFQPDGSYSMRHLSVGHAEPLRAELSAFLTAIREDSVPAVTGEEGVASLDIAMRCLGGRGEIATAAARKLARRAAG